MQITMYISVGILLFIFLIISALGINHALRFKHLSQRTLYLTYFYIGTSAVLITALLILTFTGEW